MFSTKKTRAQEQGLAAVARPCPSIAKESVTRDA